MQRLEPHPRRSQQAGRVALNGRRRFQLLLVVAVAGAVGVFVALKHYSNSSWAGDDSVRKSVLLCEQNQENLRDFTEIAYQELGLQLVLVEPKLLELALGLERTRDEHVKNRTRMYGHPEVAEQDGGKVLTWYDHAKALGDEDPEEKRSVKSVVDYSLPLTVFGSPRSVCNQWRTSFALFYKEGVALQNGTAVTKMSWRLADLGERMEKAGFSVAVFEGDDPRLSNAAVGVLLRSADPLLLHMRFFRGKHNIYLTILYERSEAGHYWHSNLMTANGTKSPVHFGFHAGSWERFQSRKIHLDFGVSPLVPDGIHKFLERFEDSRFVECNMGRAEHFFKANPPTEGVPGEEQFVINARRVLLLGRSVLDKLDIPFWISSGTCLGWFRQCSIIPHSKDVDFGIFIDSFSENIVTYMLMKGFKLKHRFGKVADSLELSFMLDDIKLDFFFFYEEDTYMWNGGTQARTGKKYKYVFPKFSLCWTEFVGLRVRVPCQAQSYIEANYGLLWDTPVKQWDWKGSPPNVHENGNWDESELKKVIQVY